MNQSISPKAVIAIVALLVVCVGAYAAWVWTRPSASVGAASATDTSQSKDAMGTMSSPKAAREAIHGAPDKDEMQRIREWKRQNPGATTKF